MIAHIRIRGRKGWKSPCQIKDLFFMHYIRLLKSPRYSAGPRNRTGSVSALITITSDLGDDFYFRDAVITAEVLQESGESRLVLASKEFQWKMGMRVLKIELNVTPSKHNFQDSVILVISGTAGKTPAADDISHPRNGSLEIITAYSPAFHQVDGEEAEKYIQRRVMIGPCKTLRIWEETGESIARHIWDGGLALTAYLAQNAGSNVFSTDKLNALHEQLNLKKKLNVLELGSGCGVVGLSLASLYEKCHVTMTDLPSAEEILTKNLEDYNSNIQGSVEFKVLDWEQAIPESLAPQSWDVIFIADCTYNTASAHSLVNVVKGLVGESPHTVVVLAHKRRHDSEDLFFELMSTVFGMVDRVAFNNGNFETEVLVDIYTFKLMKKGS